MELEDLKKVWKEKEQEHQQLILQLNSLKEKNEKEEHCFQYSIE